MWADVVSRTCQRKLVTPLAPAEERTSGTDSNNGRDKLRAGNSSAEWAPPELQPDSIDHLHTHRSIRVCKSELMEFFLLLSPPFSYFIYFNLALVEHIVMWRVGQLIQGSPSPAHAWRLWPSACTCLGLDHHQHDEAPSRVCLVLLLLCPHAHIHIHVHTRPPARTRATHIYPEFPQRQHLPTPPTPHNPRPEPTDISSQTLITQTRLKRIKQHVKQQFAPIGTTTA